MPIMIQSCLQAALKEYLLSFGLPTVYIVGNNYPFSGS